MKVPTHISAYDPDGDRKWVDEVEKKQDVISDWLINRFLARNFHDGELRNVDAHAARQIILDSY